MKYLITMLLLTSCYVESPECVANEEIIKMQLLEIKQTEKAYKGQSIKAFELGYTIATYDVLFSKDSLDSLFFANYDSLRTIRTEAFGADLK